jgi:hypothetical protein
MTLEEIFQGKSKHLFWKRVNKDQIADTFQEEPIENDQAYFEIRMKEMYLRRTRILWRKYFPMLHAFVQYGANRSHTIAGPGQLKEFAERNIDRVVNLNHLLAGITPYKGGDVTIVVGLFSVPWQDASRTLLDTLSFLTNLGGITLEHAIPIANVVKAGIESVIGMNATTLELGVRDSFYPGNPFCSGYYLGVNAAENQIRIDQLWVREGRLVKGADPIVARPYEDQDYILLEIGLRKHREDWPGLPGITEYQDRFSAILSDASLSVKQKRNRLNDLWPQFGEALRQSPHLVRPDQEQIAGDVLTDINARLKSFENERPFETRDIFTNEVIEKSPGAFDFLDVPVYLDLTNQDNLKYAQTALMGEPFS